MISKTVEDKAFEQQLIGYRRKLHENPELSMEEYETTKAIEGWLDEAGVETIDLPLETGVLAIINGKKPGPVIALRSDIDALPIQEKTGLPFASKVPGKMHACGHDFHMASMLGAAQLLNGRTDEIEGTVRIIFQPAEETGAGALRVLKTGVLDGVRAILGMHDMPNLATGTIGIKSGPLMAAVDHFLIEIKGKGTHAAAPENGVDPVVIASHVVTALQSIVSRTISPLNNAVISVSRLQAGNTWNVIPGKAELEGTVRTFQEDVRARIPGKMRRIAEGVAQAFGAQAILTYNSQGPSLQNDEKLSGWAAETARKSGLHVVTPIPSTIGEDFAQYLEKIPGAFFFMGVSGNSNLHEPDLIIDEQAIAPSARFFADLAIDVLKKLNKE
ncbi:amidohydrolase [Sporolactobacillus sp. THM7-4]|nr:amidohydrolase [Sporolactobacillus sp. THM7-4]